jgi:hypothetical protein
VNSLQSVILTLAVAYAVIGALLLIVLVYARLHWALKAAAVIVTSAFYVVSFAAMQGLLGWASTDRLPVSFKLLQARIVEPHSLEGDPGSIYLWVEELDADNRPSAIPRAYRVPYNDALAEKTHAAENEIAAGRPQGGRAADFGGGDGTIIDMVREYVTPKAVLETAGGDSSTGEFKAPPAGAQGAVFTPLPPPRMPPKDEQ